jgi:Ca2+-binding RTX toxin-like protein
VRVKLGVLVMAGIVVFAAPVAAQVVIGTGDDDRLKGSPRKDTLSGRSGDDVLRALSGKDRLKGGPGDDVLIGGKGGDAFKPGGGQDGVNMRDGVELPSPGADVIRARDGSADQISCGDGNDRVFVDLEEEGVYDCETVIEPRGGGR